ncbi:MAG: efflux RND transporter periplasmic adaptor subunit [Myxococcales bacterium]|jgi:HlyD family secretion protein
MKRTRVWAVALVVAVAAGGGYLLWKERGTPREAPAAVRVRAGRGDLTVTAQASGKVEPHTQVEVKSRAPGEVIEIFVTEGEEVEAGQLLLRLDPTPTELAVRNARTALQRLQAQLAEARASLSVAEAEAIEAEQTSAVQTRGAELGVVAGESERTARSAAAVKRRSVDLRRAQVKAAQAQLAAARLALEDAERQHRETEIHAPFAGTVLSVDVEKGSIASSALTNVGGGNALMTLADLSDLRVIGQIDEAQVGRVEVGQDVTIRVDAYPNRSFQGRVERVSPLGVEESNVVTFDVEIVVTDPDAALLRSGMSADLEIITARRSGVLLLPLTAVRTEGGKRFVRKPDGSLSPVRTGEHDGVHIEILEGLSEGDEVLAATTEAAGAGSGSSRRGLFGPPRRR